MRCHADGRPYYIIIHLSLSAQQPRSLTAYAAVVSASVPAVDLRNRIAQTSLHNVREHRELDEEKADELDA